jgi:hypothetical protein
MTPIAVQDAYTWLIGRVQKLKPNPSLQKLQKLQPKRLQAKTRSLAVTKGIFGAISEAR